MSLIIQCTESVVNKGRCFFLLPESFCSQQVRKQCGEGLCIRTCSLLVWAFSCISQPPLQWAVAHDCALSLGIVPAFCVPCPELVHEQYPSVLLQVLSPSRLTMTAALRLHASKMQGLGESFPGPETPAWASCEKEINISFFECLNFRDLLF